jgi:hypothetical protein
MASKAMRRRQREKMAFRKNIRLRLIDRQRDFWLVSVLRSQSVAYHYEVYGKVHALKFFRKLCNPIQLM